MTINYNGKTFNSIEELIEYKRTHPEEMEGVEVADKIIVNNFSSIDTLKDFGSRHSSNEGGSKRRFTNINIGGKSFNSWDEVKQYKREHPEWTGVGQIIDSVGPGETVTFNSGSIHGSVSGSSRKSGGSSNSSSGRRTIITSGSVTINRGGKKYSFSGDKIEKYDGTWYVDGKPVDPETYGGSYDEYNVSKIDFYSSGNKNIQLNELKTFTTLDAKTYESFNVNEILSDLKSAEDMNLAINMTKNLMQVASVFMPDEEAYVILVGEDGIAHKYLIKSKTGYAQTNVNLQGISGKFSAYYLLDNVYYNLNKIFVIDN